MSYTMKILQNSIYYCVDGYKKFNIIYCRTLLSKRVYISTLCHLKRTVKSMINIHEN